MSWKIHFWIIDHVTLDWSAYTVMLQVREWISNQLRQNTLLKLCMQLWILRLESSTVVIIWYVEAFG